MPGDFYQDPIPLVCPDCGTGLTAAKPLGRTGQEAANMCPNADCPVHTVTVTLYGENDRRPETIAAKAYLPPGSPELVNPPPLAPPVRRDARGVALP